MSSTSSPPSSSSSPVGTTGGGVPASSGRRRPTRVSGEEREHAIVATLQDALGEQPFHAISVDDLARGAGISRPTFYFYFASKEAVLLTLLDRLVAAAQRTPDGALEQLEDDPIRAWRLAISGAYAMWTENRHVVRAAAETRASNTEVRDRWTRLLAFFVDRTAEAITAERERGVAPDGLPAGELAVCLNRMNERLFETTLEHDEVTLADDRMIDALVEVWVRAIYGSPPS